MAFLSLLGGGKAGAAPPETIPGKPLAPRAPQFKPRVRRVIYLFQAGAPSHLDLFDPKAELVRRNGKLPPPELLKDYRAAFIDPSSALLGAKFAFRPQGQCGTEFSELLPGIGALPTTSA